jgi:hypothetical protein
LEIRHESKLPKTHTSSPQKPQNQPIGINSDFWFSGTRVRDKTAIQTKSKYYRNFSYVLGHTIYTLEPLRNQVLSCKVDILSKKRHLFDIREIFMWASSWEHENRFRFGSDLSNNFSCVLLYCFRRMSSYTNLISRNFHAIFISKHDPCPGTACIYKVYFQHQKCEKMSILKPFWISFFDLNSYDSRKNSCNNEILCNFGFRPKVGVLVRKSTSIGNRVFFREKTLKARHLLDVASKSVSQECFSWFSST